MEDLIKKAQAINALLEMGTINIPALKDFFQEMLHGKPEPATRQQMMFKMLKHIEEKESRRLFLKSKKG